jgi:hypothetical protein
MARIAFFVGLCLTLLSFTSCYAQKEQSNKKVKELTDFSKSAVKAASSKPDDGLTYENLVKDLDVMLGMYAISSSNIVKIEKKGEDAYEVKVQGEKYEKRPIGEPSRLCVGLINETDFKKCVADAAKKLGGVFLRKENAFQWIALSYSK